MQSRAARLARGWVTGAFATVVAAVLHVSAGGVAPSALAILAGLVFAGLLATALTGRRPSLPRLVIAVALSQTAFHSGFSLLGTDAVVAAQRSAHHAASFEVAGGAHASHDGAPLMWLAHLAAGLLTIAFLRMAERGIWSLIEDAARAIVSAVRRPQLSPVLVVAAPRIPAMTIRPLVGRLLESTLRQRGPPLLAGT